MKPIIFLTAWLLITAAPGLLAQPYSLDKNGDGTLGAPAMGGPYPMPSQMAPDPTGGITNHPVLIYSLEWPVIAGDLALTNSEGTITELLRFYNPSAGGDSKLIFYSQTNASEQALADVGIPGSLNPVKISEACPTTSWSPAGTSQPGFPAGGIPVYDLFTYQINLLPASAIWISGTNLIWILTGPADVQFAVIATTNLSRPASNWTRISTNVLSQPGYGKLVLPMEPDKPRRFYRLAIPP